MNSVRAKLDRMGRPRFRLSCREADWFGANDSDHLKSVAPDGAVTVLRLEPLSGQDVRQILLANLGIDDPENFIASAQGRGLQGLLANPHSLRDARGRRRIGQGLAQHQDAGIRYGLPHPAGGTQ